MILFTAGDTLAMFCSNAIYSQSINNVIVHYTVVRNLVDIVLTRQF